MEKLRIHKMKYRNRGMANKKLKGLNEFHVIFKFNTDEQATGFITQVKEWYYSLEKVGYIPPFDIKKDALKKPIDETPKTSAVKKSAPAKRKTGRTTKKVVQGQKR